MKNLLLLSFGLVIIFSAEAQNEVLQNLWKDYRLASSDTAKANVLTQISRSYLDFDPDTAFTLAIQALKLAQNKGDKELELKCKLAEAWAFVQIGANQQALEIGLNSLREAEALRGQKFILKIYNLISFIYSEIQDFDKALLYAYKILESPLLQNDSLNSISVFVNLGDFYLRKNQLDSARFYNNKAYDLAVKINEPDLIALIQNNFGNIFLKMQQPDMALLYYRQSLPFALSTNYTTVICESSMGIAKIFERNRQFDSVLFYANQSLAASSKAKFSSYVLQSAHYLAGCYTKVGNPDSALKYMSLSMSIRDSLFSREKLNQIKAMELQEVSREQDKA